MVNFLTGLHDGIRWIVILLLIAVLIKTAIGWLSNRPYEKFDRQLWLGLVNALGIQLILGLILIVWRTIQVGFVRPFWEHAVLNIIAIGIIMYAARFRKLEDTLHHRNKFFAVVVTSVLIVVAVSLVNGWTF